MDLPSKGILAEEEGPVEYSESRDREMVVELEKECEFINGDEPRKNKSKATSKGVSISTYTISSDPLCRIRPYPLRVMLVGT